MSLLKLYARDRIGLFFGVVFVAFYVVAVLAPAAPEAAPEVLATVMALARTIKKVAVVSGVCFGFIDNRMLEPYAWGEPR